MYHYLTKNEYPSGVSEYRKREIRKKAKRFTVKDGELYYIQGKTKHKVSFIIMGCLSYMVLHNTGGKIITIHSI